MLIGVNVRVDVSDQGATHLAALAAHGDGDRVRKKATAVVARTIRRALERLAGDWPEKDFCVTLAVQPHYALEDEEEQRAERAAASQGVTDAARVPGGDTDAG